MLILLLIEIKAMQINLLRLFRRMPLNFLIIIVFTACSSDNNLVYKSENFRIFPNRVEQGEYKAVAKKNSQITSNYTGLKENTWKQKRKLFEYPAYKSNHVLLNAIYNLSLEEIDRNVLGDTLFTRESINTRDLGYASVLSLAILQPEVCQNSLMQRVKNDRIIQDPGTGGSWPVNSDRLIWAVAAWEIYKATGDNDWLRKAYFIIKNSIEENVNVTWDYHAHLFKGEASFLNKREQSYPSWMSPIDIYETYSFSNQIVHYEALQSLISMGKLLNKDIQKYVHISEALKKSIHNKFLILNKKHSSLFRYKNYDLTAEQSDGLGESLAIAWGASDQLAENIPVTKFGVPCFYPQLSNTSNLHNNTVWSFVQAYWNWAAAENKNSKAVLFGLANSIRSTALFLTNNKSILIENGEYNNKEPQTKADVLSASASISNYLRVIMGIRLTTEQLEFNPIIPRELKGKHTLNNLKYHNAILDIEILGFGNRINSFTFDGTPYKRAVVPKDIEGYHKVVIKMNNQIPTDESFTINKNKIAPPTPVLAYRNQQLQWNKIKEANHYLVFQNGDLLLETKDNYMVDLNFEEPVEYMVQAVDSLHNYSFLSKPLTLYASKYEKFLEAEAFQVKNKNSYVVLRKSDNEPYYFQVKATKKAEYEISFLYANGNGPFNDGYRCANRSFWLNSGYLGTIVFPQRGTGNWNDYGYSNSFKVKLKKGYNFFKISFEDFNNNMAEDESAIRIDKIRVLRRN